MSKKVMKNLGFENELMKEKLLVLIKTDQRINRTHRSQLDQIKKDMTYTSQN